jgi:hypothetical protein
MTTVTLDALDAIELAEILEFLLDCVDTAHITTPPAGHGDAYNLDDLRADTARLAGRLLTSPLAATPLTVEVDHGSASSRGRPSERAWLVRLRHADRSVVVAIGLSRTAANHLAERITDVIDPTATRRQTIKLKPTIGP